MWRKAAIAAACLAGLAVGAYFSRHALRQAVHAIASADPNWLSLAALAFFGATVAAAGSWMCAVDAARQLLPLRRRLARQHVRPLPGRRRRADRALQPARPAPQPDSSDHRLLRRARRRPGGRP